eukprot:COSAG01_NODE_6997_length_3399_cov_2.340000_1_plen_168_part_00
MHADNTALTVGLAEGRHAENGPEARHRLAAWLAFGYVLVARSGKVTLPGPGARAGCACAGRGWLRAAACMIYYILHARQLHQLHAGARWCSRGQQQQQAASINHAHDHAQPCRQHAASQPSTENRENSRARPSDIRNTTVWRRRLNRLSTLASITCSLLACCPIKRF